MEDGKIVQYEDRRGKRITTTAQAVMAVAGGLGRVETTGNSQGLEERADV
jgi:hypothetical protein